MKKEIFKFYKETFNARWGHRIYEVSDAGNVKVNGKLVNLKGNSYYDIGCFRVHRAIAELFVPNPNNYNEVDHINGDKHDNRAENLRWCTHAENMSNPVTLNNQKLSYYNPEIHKKICDIAKVVHNTEEAKINHSKAASDRVWMNNGINKKFPKIDDVNYWLTKGYVVGYGTKKINI